jgi:hypothetical protein
MIAATKLQQICYGFATEREKSRHAFVYKEILELFANKPKVDQ